MEAESSVGACIVRKALTEGPAPLRLDTVAISDNGFRLRISSILPDLICTFKSTTTFFAFAMSSNQVIEALSRSDQVLAQFKSCIVILPCSSSSCSDVADHIADNEHQDMSYMFTDGDPLLLAIHLVQSLHPDVLDSLSDEISNAWSERASSWEAFELAVRSLKLDLGSTSTAACLSFYESLHGISLATSGTNAFDEIADLSGISKESAHALVQVFQGGLS